MLDTGLRRDEMNSTRTLSVGIRLFLLGGLGFASGCSTIDHNEDEVKITMSELPGTVKPQAEKEVAGCQIKEVEKELKGGKTIYAITYLDKEGILMELEYAEDGTLISKEKE
jgi:hypothetical protein